MNDSGIAALTFAWIASYPRNQPFLIEHGAVELFFSQISEKDLNSYPYVDALKSLAEGNTDIQQKYGKEGVQLALQMMESTTLNHTARFLAALLAFAPNREIMRANNGIAIVQNFIKKGGALIDGLVVAMLSDTSEMRKMVCEFSGLLINAIKSADNDGDDYKKIRNVINCCDVSSVQNIN